MKRIRLVSLALLVGLSSCLSLEQTVTIAADGSGKFVFSMTMREATIAEVQQASAAAQLGAAADPTAVFDKAITERELTTAGLRLESHEAIQEAGKRTVRLAATFGDFRALQQNPLNGTQAEWVLAKGPKAGTGKLTLYPQGRAAWLEARQKAEQLQTNVDPMVAEFFAKRRLQLAGLDMVLRLELPGEVFVWTKNLEKTGDRQVTATIKAADIQTPEDLVRRLAPRFEVVFDASACSLPLE